MLLPGSKGWIEKYFNLLEKGKIVIRYEQPDDAELEEFIHAALARTGIVFGYPSRFLFAKDVDATHWTTEERLKFLLFESLLFVYKLKRSDEAFTKTDFLSTLHSFYENHSAKSIQKIFRFLLRETKEENIESILTKRVDIKVNYLENKFWVNYFNNVFIYLDVILFHAYLQETSHSKLFNYTEMAMNALNAITLAAYADGKIDNQEKTMFSVFLASANLSEMHRDIAESRFEKGATVADFTPLLQSNILLKYFVLDLSAFVLFSNFQHSKAELQHLQNLSVYMGLNENHVHKAIAITEQFLLSNQKQIPFLTTSSSVEKLYSSLSVRWIRILGRNKDKLAVEIKQSKELVFLIKKSATTELNKQEKELVKTQFKDIVKSMPSLAIFMLPGGAVLLPLVLKVIPDLLPSAFRDNELEK